MLAAALWAGDSPRGVASNETWTPGRPLHLGEVPGALPALDDAPVTVATAPVPGRRVLVVGSGLAGLGARGIRGHGGRRCAGPAF